MTIGVFDRFSLAGKTALVVGAGPGIGAHVARAFAKAGANVVVSARTADKVEMLAQDIERQGGRALAVTGDAGAAADNLSLVDRAEATFGTVHILLYNAFAGSIAIDADPFAADDEHCLRAFAVNVLGHRNLLEAAPEAVSRVPWRALPERSARSSRSTAPWRCMMSSTPSTLSSGTRSTVTMQLPRLTASS